MLRLVCALYGNARTKSNKRWQEGAYGRGVGFRKRERMARGKAVSKATIPLRKPALAMPPAHPDLPQKGHVEPIEARKAKSPPQSPKRPSILPPARLKNDFMLRRLHFIIALDAATRQVNRGPSCTTSPSEGEVGPQDRVRVAPHYPAFLRGGHKPQREVAQVGAQSGGTDLVNQGGPAGIVMKRSSPLSRCRRP